MYIFYKKKEKEKEKKKKIFKKNILHSVLRIGGTTTLTIQLPVFVKINNIINNNCIKGILKLILVIFCIS
jgi:hypothetical protein